jgi:hypothetical protein
MLLPAIGKMRCGICGGRMQGGAIYRAKEDNGDKLFELPAQQCLDCGNIYPDVEKIDELSPRDVPSSVRLRCAQIRVVH